MKCPFCFNPETKVTDKREQENLETTRRRRECLKCKKRFTTYERTECDLNIIKKDGKIQNYEREKLKKGILKACEKRNINNEEVEKIINNIESNLRNKCNGVKSNIIGELVMKHLKTLDNVAYIRFASVYKDFADITDFQEELKKIKIKR